MQQAEGAHPQTGFQKAKPRTWRVSAGVGYPFRWGAVIATWR
jgi:hypothetical protein